MNLQRMEKNRTQYTGKRNKCTNTIKTNEKRKCGDWCHCGCAGVMYLMFQSLGDSLIYSYVQTQNQLEVCVLQIALLYSYKITCEQKSKSYTK